MALQLLYFQQSIHKIYSLNQYISFCSSWDLLHYSIAITNKDFLEFCTSTGYIRPQPSIKVNMKSPKTAILNRTICKLVNVSTPLIITTPRACSSTTISARFRSAITHTTTTTRLPIYASLPAYRSGRNFSALPAEEDEPRKRRTLETKNPLAVTERAAHRIKEMLKGDSAQGAIGIRLGVKRRGCNGLSYTLNYAFETPAKDLEMESNGVTVFVEPMALFNVVGTVMDWEETELSSEFTFKNPNSKGECGCGESFTV